MIFFMITFSQIDKSYRYEFKTIVISYILKLYDRDDNNLLYFQHIFFYTQIFLNI
jgi:hypothetical protein